MDKITKFKIICSVLVGIITLVFLLLSIFTKNDHFDTIFKISVTASISVSLTLSLTFNINSIRNSFNSTYYLCINNNEVFSLLKKCEKLHTYIENIIGFFNQKLNLKIDKEKVINSNLKKAIDLAGDMQESTKVLAISKDLNNTEKERVMFVSEILTSFLTIKELYPIKLINVFESVEKNKKLLAVLKTIDEKYNIYMEEKREEV